ncbi:hypothetical protein QJS04_geneDACA021194 [Acorus gramineus]|uniref:Uncharacterized protein n=1 Tax=Acorus gramineus TaxID=55184 RepID=A0AAV9AJM9_ACOGR|nr:hypothetical protein QJS04_geneDACA021194 [Acorus gramineus]
MKVIKRSSRFDGVTSPSLKGLAEGGGGEAFAFELCKPPSESRKPTLLDETLLLKECLEE